MKDVKVRRSPLWRVLVKYSVIIKMLLLLCFPSYIYATDLNTNSIIKNSNISAEIVDIRSEKANTFEKQLNPLFIEDRPTLGKFLSVFDQQPQKRMIKGKVIDSNGDAIPGTTIIVKGTTIGAITDYHGNFSLSIPIESKILTFSFVGYKTQEVSIDDQSLFNITLNEATVGVEEVVVVGYGQQKKETVVGSISQTTSEELQRTGNVTDMSQALTGLLPGVTTIVSSGEPGGVGKGESATSIFIRGQNTWNGGQPLILVDGIERNMENLDINEVANISVLKDASATAVFGVKGANGVILITTKRGAVGKPKLSFSYNTTAKMLSKLPTPLDSYNAILLRNESVEREVPINSTSWGDYIPFDIAKRYAQPQDDPNYAMIYPSVNWREEMFKNMAFSHRATVNVRGGTEFVNYFGSLAYLHEGDMFKDYENNKGYDPNYDFDRFNFRSNFDFKLTKSTKLKVNLSGFYGIKNTTYNFDDAWIWAGIYSMAPDLYLPRYDDGRWGWSSYSTKPNPLANLYNLGIEQERETQLNSDFTLEQDLSFILKGLSAKISVFSDKSMISSGGLYDVTTHARAELSGNTLLKIIYPERYTGPDQDPAVYISNVPTTSSRDYFDFYVLPWYLNRETLDPAYIKRRKMYQFQMNYDRKFGKNSIGIMGLAKREEYARGSEFVHYREDWVFRTTYDYDTRYLFEMNGAYNGSEQFGPGYRFDFFPSVAFGWVISNEKFFRLNWIEQLKLRLSTGIVGDDRVSGGRWLYNSQFSYGGFSRLNSNPNSGASPYTWYRESVVGNPDIHWEKALKNNFGIEMGVYKNLFTISYDYFTEDRTDILLAGSLRNVPPFFGATPPAANVGRVKSNGHELEVKYDKRISGGLHYWSSLSFTHTENEILEKDDPPLRASYLNAAGYAVDQQRSTIRTGFYNNWDEVFASVPLETNDLHKLPGFYNLIDFNGDGMIKANEDAVPFGYSRIPQNTYNFSIGADFKGFSAMLQFYGVTNVTRYVPRSNFWGNTNVVFDHVLDYWAKDNQDASSFLPRWKTQAQSIGEYYYLDGSYLRLKTVEIAYTLQDKFIKKAGLSSLKLYINGNNLLFWSDLPDDREASFSGGSDAAGTYPTVKRVNLGIDVTF
jgi:TonB-linked SusC/RagA family outer membrane protein